MKRLLTVLFVIAGLAFAQSAFAQTTTPPKKDKKAKKSSVDSTNQRSSGTAAPAPAPGSGSGDAITIDESGAPRPKTKKPAKAAAPPPPAPDPKREEQKGSAKEAPESGGSAPDSPSEIAIDEAGATRPTKGKPAKVETANPPANDSTTISPALQIIRPE